eukprot:14878532-Ditylum_brightwellii.AAC.1
MAHSAALQTYILCGVSSKASSYILSPMQPVGKKSSSTLMCANGWAEGTPMKIFYKIMLSLVSVDNDT